MRSPARHRPGDLSTRSEYPLGMVRPDESVGLLASAGELLRSGCARPAGASPAPVGAGAPGSRPQARGEIRVSRAGRREPLRREQESGSQREVNPAASSEKQCGSRAAHLTAKATSTVPVPERAAGSTGVGGATRSQGGVRNRRGPSSLPSSRRGAAYKPKVKSQAAERESEGIVVVRRAAQQNAVGAKGPWAGSVGLRRRVRAWP